MLSGHHGRRATQCSYWSPAPVSQPRWAAVAPEREMEMHPAFSVESPCHLHASHAQRGWRRPGPVLCKHECAYKSLGEDLCFQAGSALSEELWVKRLMGVILLLQGVAGGSRQERIKSEEGGGHRI